MSNAFDDIGEHTIKLLHMSGHEGVVYNYSRRSGEREWYEETIESEWIEDSGTPITIRVTHDSNELTRGISGRTLQGDASIAVDPSEATFTYGAGENERASEVVDQRSGDRYRVTRIVNDHGGVWELDCERIQPPT